MRFDFGDNRFVITVGILFEFFTVVALFPWPDLPEIAEVEEEADAFEGGEEDGEAGPPEYEADNAVDFGGRGHDEKQAHSEAEEQVQYSEEADKDEARLVCIPLAFTDEGGMGARLQDSFACCEGR